MRIFIHIAGNMRTNIEIDDELMEEAFRLTNVRTKKELVHLALMEFVKAKKKKDLLELSGKIQFHEGYDYKALRGS
jgi:Arc/MetJ family transcription regulator